MIDDNYELVIQNLKDKGYFKYVPSTELPHVLEQAAKNLKEKSLIGFSDNPMKDPQYLDYRMYDADAENLAEGDIGELLRKTKTVLENAGVEFSSVIDEITSNKYDLLIDNKRYSIFTGETINSPDSWEIAFLRLLEIINELLKNANSEERLYGMYGGNDGIIVFLTEDLYQFITKNNLFEISYLPS